jgi:hypothetical protein
MYLHLNIRRKGEKVAGKWKIGGGKGLTTGGTSGIIAVALKNRLMER